MKVKCIIHKIQNDELQHDEDFESKHPRDKGGKFTTKDLAIASAKATEEMLKGIQTISTEASKLPVEKGKNVYGRYPDMSEAELQKTVNRLRLEHSYSDLVGDTKYTKSGSEKTREIMQTIGAVAGIAGSLAASVALILQVLPKKAKTAKKVAKVASEVVK